MPFQSKAQQKWMFATYPAMAKRWAAETPDVKALPEHVQTLRETIKKRLVSGASGKVRTS